MIVRSEGIKSKIYWCFWIICCTIIGELNWIWGVSVDEGWNESLIRCFIIFIWSPFMVGLIVVLSISDKIFLHFYYSAKFAGNIRYCNSKTNNKLPNWNSFLSAQYCQFFSVIVFYDTYFASQSQCSFQFSEMFKEICIFMAHILCTFLQWKLKRLAQIIFSNKKV